MSQEHKLAYHEEKDLEALRAQNKLIKGVLFICRGVQATSTHYELDHDEDPSDENQPLSYALHNQLVTEEQLEIALGEAAGVLTCVVTLFLFEKDVLVRRGGPVSTMKCSLVS